VDVKEGVPEEDLAKVANAQEEIVIVMIKAAAVKFAVR